MTPLLRVDLATCREVDGSGIESEVEPILLGSNSRGQNELNNAIRSTISC